MIASGHKKMPSLFHIRSAPAKRYAGAIFATWSLREPITGPIFHELLTKLGLVYTVPKIEDFTVPLTVVLGSLGLHATRKKIAELATSCTHS